MKKILLILLINLSLYSNEADTDQTLINFQAAKKYMQEIDFATPIRTTADFLDSLSSKDLNATALTSKFNYFTTNAFHILSDKLSYFNVKKAQSVTYEVRVTTLKDIRSSGTAIALTSDGTLITAYHNIASYKSIQVVNNKGESFPVRVGKISLENDLAYLHIDVQNIAYAPIAKETYLGQDIYILSYDNFLLNGMASQIKQNNIILNLETKKGTSGAGVFNKNNELLSLLISKDTLHKTSNSIRPNTFEEIAQEYANKKALQRDAKDYDTVFCYNKDDSQVWQQYSKSKDLKMQELHALFKGLCNKVENRDITADEAQFIFQSAHHRLLG